MSLLQPDHEDESLLRNIILRVGNCRVETSTAAIVTALYIILGILHNFTFHHDESVVQVWVIDWELLPGIAAAAEFVCVEEEGGEEDTQYERESGNIEIKIRK